MSDKKQFSDQEINDLLSKVEIPLEKDKDLIWSEKFESLVKEDAIASSKEPSVFQLYWQYGIAASFANLLEITPDTELDLLADQTMIESLFVEDNEFDEWFEEQYVLSSVN